ncbi:MAG TPA: hypothetical protein VD907_00425 [Verrucomicrobiae bacterium]|nr:hypothetical protein [Verrucomicrobiae bacterium]
MAAPTARVLAFRIMRNLISRCNRYAIRVDEIKTGDSLKEITSFRIKRTFSLQLIEMRDNKWYLFIVWGEGKALAVWEWGESLLENFCYGCLKIHNRGEDCGNRNLKIVSLKKIIEAEEAIFRYISNP